MSETKTTSLELLDSLIEAALDRRRCPICLGNLYSTPELGCVFVPGAMSCKTMNRLMDDDPRKVEYTNRVKVLRGLQLLLAAR
jgi:hypothetical protein